MRERLGASGSASPLRALDPPGRAPGDCNYRSDGTGLITAVVDSFRPNRRGIIGDDGVGDAWLIHHAVVAMADDSDRAVMKAASDGRASDIRVGEA